MKKFCFLLFLLFCLGCNSKNENKIQKEETYPKINMYADYNQLWVNKKLMSMVENYASHLRNSSHKIYCQLIIESEKKVTLAYAHRKSELTKTFPNGYLAFKMDTVFIYNQNLAVQTIDSTDSFVKEVYKKIALLTDDLISEGKINHQASPGWIIDTPIFILDIVNKDSIRADITNHNPLNFE